MQVLEARLQRDQRQITQLTDLLSRGQFAALAMRLAQDPAAIGPVSAFPQSSGPRMRVGNCRRSSSSSKTTAWKAGR